VVHARGEWISFLDDDDEWLPRKLERQIAYAGSGRSSLIGCRSHVVTPVASYIWPEKIYDNAVPVDEYLFDRRGAFAGSGYLQTSSYLISRTLFERSPFPVPSQHDDWEFVLRLSKLFGVRIDTVPEVLVKTYAEEPRPSLSASGTWGASLAWLDTVASLLTPRAYSGFCLGVIGSRAANERAYRAFFPLLVRALTHGSPRLWHVATFLAFWVLPQGMRRRLRGLCRGSRRDPATVSTGVTADAALLSTRSGASHSRAKTPSAVQQVPEPEAKDRPRCEADPNPYDDPAGRPETGDGDPVRVRSPPLLSSSAPAAADLP
jgi:hypothetical protein